MSALREEFIRCWPWLEASLQQFFQTHTQEQVWDRIIRGQANLFSRKDAVIVGQIINHPIGVRDFRYWLQGGELSELQAMHPHIETWAREHRCDVATGIGRDGWARAMHGYWQKGPSTRIKWLND